MRFCSRNVLHIIVAYVSDNEVWREEWCTWLYLKYIHCTAVSLDGLTGIEVVDSEVVRVIFIGTIELTEQLFRVCYVT